MKLRDSLMFVFFAAGIGWAMAEGTGDVAVGVALGVGIAAALHGSRRGDRCFKGEAQ